ncbi:MAG: asparagine synthase (glutamine-hydrolyzing) [Candidatus Aenigmarchaeota archaeon]
MCGISGFAGFEDKKLLKRMCDVISHRGPDDHGYFFDKKISLGNRRLSIIDVKGGRQPIHNEDESVCIVFNGEIYNYLELREFLEKRKHRFKTDSDTETIVHLYEELGESSVDRLRGMFAFAIWDSRKKKLILVRDRLGIKPLYYAKIGEKLLFGSEIKSILQYEGVERKVVMDSLYKFVKYRYVPGNKTMFDGIYKLLPGQMLTYREGKVKLERYWEPSMRNSADKPEDYYIKKFRRLLQDSVEERLMSEVPLGAYLSGGLDSSAIVALMSRMMEEPVKTFSVGFGEESDECGYARIVAEKFNTEHKEFIIEKKKMTEALPEIVWHLDEPLGDPAVFPMWLTSNLVKKKATVALLGEGADELQAGYRDYRILSNKLFFIPSSLKKKIFNWFRSPVSMKDMRGLVTDGSSHTRKRGRFYYRFDTSAGNTLNQSLLFDLKYVLPNFQLMKVDKTTMGNSVEARVPFLDHNFVEFVNSIPTEYKLNGFEGKYILRKTMSGVLPKVVMGRKKQPFTTPIPSWFDESLEEFAKQVLLDKKTAKRNQFSPDYVKRLFRKRKKATRKGKYNYQIWMLLMVEMWNRIFIDRDDVYKSKLELNVFT